MIKRNLFVIAMVVYNLTTFAQNSNSHLLFQYYGANENQCEIIYISQYLEKNNYTTPGAVQDKAIEEAHKYYLAHKEDIDMALKANELVAFRSAVKEMNAAMWSQAFSTIASSLATGIAAGNAAATAQQEEYQKKLNRNNDILAYISKNSSSTPKQYTQDFGNTPVETRTTTSPQVTTSNGFDEPLSSTNSYSTGQGTETVGMLVSNGIQQNVRLKINGNVIVGRYVGGTVRSPWGEGWTQENLQGMPTNIQIDGEWAKMYRNRATSRDIDNAIIYF